ncbi:ABC transporter ATP-binding protein [Paeniglutamicibacter kerguelensis]|uniref:Peptide/nickel transport system ATP-binding protein n=1 Tax=Paeniglutamicibacter kerguelensis TaxID=254788 RepID=A0ABS4X8J1_9MICC|nr:ABC transporter ATP-binding protein [Paeniglutamicibacter kerguelensis]MBP2384784.1 peptide/nickel transport system ATP-binding protein [Paeniglutamicibacter kerguelensis]
MTSILLDTPNVPALKVENLVVDFKTKNGVVNAVRGVSFSVDRGEVLAVVGESGSGKTITSLTTMALLPSTARTAGVVEVDGHDVLNASEADMDSKRGNVVSMVFQEPMTALNPSMKVGKQVAEAILNHRGLSKAEAMARAVELLDRVGIPDPAVKARNFPHQLSGGQRQRVVIAIALACDPTLIIADEPTTALDVTVQAEILELLRNLVKETNTALLLITHNMGVVADLSDRVVVMNAGKVIETGTTVQVLTEPAEPYTQALLAAVPTLPEAQWDAIFAEERTGEPRHAEPAGNSPLVDPVLDMREVCVDYTSGGRKLRAVNQAGLVINRGEIVGLVGESGSGKSTLGRAPLGLVPVTGGEITLFGGNVLKASTREIRKLRSRIGIIFQDPGGSLDPRMTVGDSIAEPLVMHGVNGKRPGRAERDARVRELLEAVRLPAANANRYPHELSGGQRQRIGLARALALAPELLIADEPTSALDVSVQDEVLTLLLDLQKEHGFGCLFISHDLAVVHSVSQRVTVMQHGNVIESGLSSKVLQRPEAPYTRHLLASVPSPNPIVQRQRREARTALLLSSGTRGS